MSTYWLIEYREGHQTVGYLKDLRRGDGGLDVFVTRESARAFRFDTERSARDVIEDWAFQRTVPRADQFFVEGHMDCPDLLTMSEPRCTCGGLLGDLARPFAPCPVHAPKKTCRGCGKVLQKENLTMADGCPCNTPRGLNHGSVPTSVCTCVNCDPAQTGASRYR